MEKVKFSLSVEVRWAQEKKEDAPGTTRKYYDRVIGTGIVCKTIYNVLCLCVCLKLMVKKGNQLRSVDI